MIRPMNSYEMAIALVLLVTGVLCLYNAWILWRVRNGAQLTKWLVVYMTTVSLQMSALGITQLWVWHQQLPTASNIRMAYLLLSAPEYIVTVIIIWFVFPSSRRAAASDSH